MVTVLMWETMVSARDQPLLAKRLLCGRSIFQLRKQGDTRVDGKDVEESALGSELKSARLRRRAEYKMFTCVAGHPIFGMLNDAWGHTEPPMGSGSWVVSKGIGMYPCRGTSICPEVRRKLVRSPTTRPNGWRRDEQRKKN